MRPKLILGCGSIRLICIINSINNGIVKRKRYAIFRRFVKDTAYIFLNGIIYKLIILCTV